MMNTLELSAIIAETLLNQDFEVVSHVPGFGGTQVFERVTERAPSKGLFCLNEEAAFSISTGAAIFGSRSATLVKTQGLAKMANALCSTLSIGANGANLIFAFDDTAGKSSDNIFDAKVLIKGLEAPFLVLGQNAEESIIKATAWSESLRLPVIVYVDCENLKELQVFRGQIERRKRVDFKKDPTQYVACPPLSQFQRAVFLEKMNPSTAGSRRLEAPEMRELPRLLPPHLRAVYDSYGFFFEAFSKIEVDFASGDAGTSSLYAFDQNSSIDACTYMGGAPGMALGAHLAGAKRSWAFTGDFSFLAAGILGLNEIISKNAPVKVVIFNNGIAGATGGQEVPKRVFELFKNAHSPFLHTLTNGTNGEEITRILKVINDATIPQILVVGIP
jgi:TPP-dependent indolepyruvate ferredoxin oxidoreductase alpha subunit